MKYQLASRREEAVTVDGLGVLPPATRESKDGPLVPSVTEFGSQEAENFRFYRGLSLAQVSLPEGVELTLVITAATEEGS